MIVHFKAYVKILKIEAMQHVIINQKGKRVYNPNSQSLEVQGCGFVFSKGKERREGELLRMMMMIATMAMTVNDNGKMKTFAFRYQIKDTLILSNTYCVLL